MFNFPLSYETGEEEEEDSEMDPNVYLEVSKKIAKFVTLRVLK